MLHTASIWLFGASVLLFLRILIDVFYVFDKVLLVPDLINLILGLEFDGCKVFF
jgi:hypothetical protein